MGLAWGLPMLQEDLAEGIRAPRNEGGYDGYPVLSQFGYQNEIRYLSAGNFNATVSL